MAAEGVAEERWDGVKMRREGENVSRRDFARGPNRVPADAMDQRGARACGNEIISIVLSREERQAGREAGGDTKAADRMLRSS